MTKPENAAAESIFSRYPIASAIVVGLVSLVPHFFLTPAMSLGFAAILLGIVAGVYFGFAVTNGNNLQQQIEFNVSFLFAIAALLGLRIIASIATLASGGVGGLFIPLVVAGALTGRFVGGLHENLDTALYTVIGVASFLGAGYQVPLAAVVFVAEISGSPAYVVPGLLAAVVADLVAGTSSVTTYQQARG